MSDIVKVYQEACDLLREQLVPFWAVCGTLLGCVRDNKFIENDDIDFAIFEEHRDRVNITTWLQHGWSLSRELGSEERGWEYTLTKNRINLDLFFMHEDGNALWFNVGDRVIYRFHLSSYDDELVRFHDRFIYRFRKYEEMLEQNYGDWRTRQYEWSCYTDAPCIEPLRTSLPSSV